MLCTFAKSRDSNKIVSCSRITPWAYNDMGVMKKYLDLCGGPDGEINDLSKAYADSSFKKCVEVIKIGNKTSNELRKDGELKPGDALYYTGHVNVYIGNGEYYDAGRGGERAKGYFIDGVYKFNTLRSKVADSRKVNYIMRLKDQSKIGVNMAGTFK